VKFYLALELRIFTAQEFDFWHVVWNIYLFIFISTCKIKKRWKFTT